MPLILPERVSDRLCLKKKERQKFRASETAGHNEFETNFANELFLKRLTCTVW